jgi:hypothetical protein
MAVGTLVLMVIQQSAGTGRTRSVMGAQCSACHSDSYNTCWADSRPLAGAQRITDSQHMSTSSMDITELHLPEHTSSEQAKAVYQQLLSTAGDTRALHKA